MCLIMREAGMCSSHPRRALTTCRAWWPALGTQKSNMGMTILACVVLACPQRRPELKAGLRCSVPPRMGSGYRGLSFQEPSRSFQLPSWPSPLSRSRLPSMLTGTGRKHTHH